MGGFLPKGAEIQEKHPFLTGNRPPVTLFFLLFFGLVEWEMEPEKLVHNLRTRVAPPHLRM